MHFKRVAVIGGGTMGQGIAHVMAASGLEAVLVDLTEERIAQVSEELAVHLDQDIAKWGLTESEKRAILSRIHFTTELSDAAGVDLVIEAVPERLEAKRKVFVELERVLGSETLKVTHTGTLSVSEIARGLEHPENVIGMHFLPPAHRVPLVEIVRGLATSDATFQAVRELAVLLGKTAVEVNEYPGYITARGIVPMLNEAMHMVMEGVASARDIDTALKLGFSLESGPLALADRIGLDQVLQWMESLFRELGEMKYRPCPLLRKMVRAGLMGVKSGRGFFTYVDGKPVVHP